MTQLEIKKIINFLTNTLPTLLKPTNKIPQGKGYPNILHPLRPNQRQRTLAKLRAFTEMVTSQNSRPKGTTSERERNHGKEKTI